MQAYSIALEIPEIVKNQLATLCFGPSQIHWIEKDHLHFLLRPLGNLYDHELKEVMDQLESLFFLPFSFTLRGISYKQFKGSGAIGFDAKDNPQLLSLNKEIEKSLRILKLKKDTEKMPFPIVLGYYEDLHFERLSDYLMANASFQSPPIEVAGVVLLRTWQSSRRTIYEEVAYYPASQLASGED